MRVAARVPGRGAAAMTPRRDAAARRSSAACAWPFGSRSACRTESARSYSASRRLDPPPWAARRWPSSASTRPGAVAARGGTSHKSGAARADRRKTKSNPSLAGRRRRPDGSATCGACTRRSRCRRSVGSGAASASSRTPCGTCAGTDRSAVRTRIMPKVWEDVQEDTRPRCAQKHRRHRAVWFPRGAAPHAHGRLVVVDPALLFAARRQVVARHWWMDRWRRRRSGVPSRAKDFPRLPLAGERGKPAHGCPPRVCSL